MRSESTPVWHRLHRHLLALAAVVVVALALLPFAEGPNPDHPGARAVADRLEAAIDEAATGVALGVAAARQGLVVDDFAVEDSAVMILHDTRPTAAGWCYGMRVGRGVVTAAVRYEDGGECTPVDRSTFAAIGSWGDVLPSERRTAPWFIPAMVVLIGAAISLSTRVVVAVITRER